MAKKSSSERKIELLKEKQKDWSVDEGLSQVKYEYNNKIQDINILKIYVTPPEDSGHQPYVRTFNKGEMWITKSGKTIPPKDMAKWLEAMENKVKIFEETFVFFEAKEIKIEKPQEKVFEPVDESMIPTVIF